MNAKLHRFCFYTACFFLCSFANLGVVCRAAAPADDLPLVEIKAADASLPLILYLSGDGGYNAFSRGLVTNISNKGYGVLVLDASKYFWSLKTPQQLASDITQLLTKHLANRTMQQVIVVGYSFGASVIPFMLTRLPHSVSEKVKMAVCISPGLFADFEVTLSTLLNKSTGNKNYPVLDECRKLGSLPCFFLFGKEENAQTTQSFIDAGTQVSVLPGSHDYRNDTGTLSRKLVALFAVK